MEDILIQFGGAVKSLGGGAFEAPLISFSGPDAPDLASEFFTDQTNFWIDFPAKVPILYDHGQDPTLKKQRIGTGTLELRDSSVWLKGQLAMAEDYQAAVQSLISAGKIGTSSGSASHMVEREPVGKSFRLTSWPIVEASLTVCPAEPKQFGRVQSLKSYEAEHGAVKSFKALLTELADAEADAAEQPAEPDAPAVETPEAVKAADTDALLDALEALPLKTFLEAMGAVASLTDRRLAWYAEQRETKQGRAISAENLAKMRDIHAGMQKHAADLGDIIARHSLNTGHSAGTGDGAVRRPEAAAGNSQSSGNKPKALGSEMGAAFMRFMQAHGGTATLAAPTAGQSVP